MLYRVRKKAKDFIKKRKYESQYVKYFQNFLVKKLDIGGADIALRDGWLVTDIQVLNIANSEDWNRLTPTNSISNIMAEHVWEHLNEQDTMWANQNCYDYLIKGGRLRLAVPDGYHPNHKYIDYVKPGGYGLGADDHKILYTYDIMRERLEAVGFRVELLEYWDEEGKFHFNEWQAEEGYITRSKRYDHVHYKNRGFEYTSLIVDAIKE